MSHAWKTAKAIFYGELKEGSRKVGAPRLRYKDVFKRRLKNTKEYNNWKKSTQLWTYWRKLEPALPPTEAANKCDTSKQQLDCIHTCVTGISPFPCHRRHRRTTKEEEEYKRMKELSDEFGMEG